MRHILYSRLALLPSFISDSFPFEESPPKPGEPDWTNEEIAAIRVVLQKLTALRIYNANDAEDLVQDTLLTMVSKHPGMIFEKGPLAWGLGILRKKVGNYYRRAHRYESLGEQDLAPIPGRIPASPEAGIFQEELKNILAEILSHFPSTQRQAMELLIAGFNAGEIARQLHPEPYQNVINSLHRGRKKIARELAKYGYAPRVTAGMTGMKKSRGRKMKPEA